MPRNVQPLSVEFILLGVLMQKPMHGYDLYKYLNTDAVINQIWNIKQSLLYAMLDKLEDMGLIRAELLNTGTLPVKREFHITVKGESLFGEWVNAPVLHPRDMRVEFLAKVTFLEQMDRKKLADILAAQKDVAVGWLDNLHQRMAEEENDIPAKMVMDYKQSQIEAMITWLDFNIKNLSH